MIEPALLAGFFYAFSKCYALPPTTFIRYDGMSLNFISLFLFEKLYS